MARMFLNPALAEIARAAFERGVVLHADNGTNLNFAREDALEALVEIRFRSLSVPIDGATPETYARYRVKGDLTASSANRPHQPAQTRIPTGFPILNWQFIVFGHNEEEIETARRMATARGMSFRLKLSWDDDVSPIRNRELVQIALGQPHVTRSEYYEANGVEYTRGICHQLWKTPVINWDGRLTGCCRNFWGDFGVDVFEEGLDAALSTERFRHAQAMLDGTSRTARRRPLHHLRSLPDASARRGWLTRRGSAAPHNIGHHGERIRRSQDIPGHPRRCLRLPGHAENRIILAEPPPSVRFEIGKSYASLPHAARPRRLHRRACCPNGSTQPIAANIRRSSGHSTRHAGPGSVQQLIVKL